MKRATLIKIYDQLNADLFNGALVRPTILCKRWYSFGQFVNGRRHTMEFNPAMIKGLSFARAIVYHEMIHQYIEEVLGKSEVNHHGEIFWRVYKWFAIGERIKLRSRF